MGLTAVSGIAAGAFGAASAAPAAAPTDSRIIILPALRQNDGIHAIPMTGSAAADAPTEIVADGYWEPGDGGGGRFRWQAESYATEDGFMVFAPRQTTGSGRWHRIADPAYLHFEMAGARGDGVTNDFDRCQEMLALANRYFGQCRVVLRPGKTYLIDYGPEAAKQQAIRGEPPGGGGLIVHYHCIIEGPGAALGMTAAGVPGLSSAARFILHPRMTIRLAYFAELRDLQIVRKDMKGPVDHFSVNGPTSLEDMQAQIDVWMAEDGTRPDVNGGVRSVAITNNGIDTNVRRVLVMGFHTAYLSDGFGRPVVDQLYFDTAGRGIDISHSADDAYVHYCYSNAFWSANLGAVRNSRGDQARRPGIAFDFHDKTDGLRCIDCSSAGYVTGLRLSNVWAVTVSGLNVEPAGHPPHEVTRGVLTENCVSHTTFINPLIDGFTYKMDLQHRPVAFTQGTGPHNTPGPGQYGSASVSVVGGSLQGNPIDPPGHRALRLGPHSSGSVTGVVLAGFPDQPAILAEPGVGIWKFVAVDPSLRDFRPLFDFSNDHDRSNVLRFGCDQIDGDASPQWTIGGRIVLNELPNSPFGLPRGALWRDGGTVSIVE